MRIIEIIKFTIGFIICLKHGVKKQGHCYLGWNTKIVNRGSIQLGSNIIIRPSTGLYTHRSNSRINIGVGSEIGNHSTIAALNLIEIGDFVLTGPHVYIADYNHQYNDIDIPICKQGERSNMNDRVKIGDGTWIGTNAVIVGNVCIGKNCVVGANAVVTKDIPDFCIAAGSPCRIIKMYNVNTKQWEKVL